jgi:hypothetical protein
VTRHKTDYQATVSPTVMFAVFCVYWLEDAVWSEIEDENNIEHYSLPQYDTEHNHVMNKYRGSKNINTTKHILQ